MISVVVVGFGLIGGSFACALRERGLVQSVVAVDLPDVLRTDAVSALSDRRIPVDDARQIERALICADLVVLSAPVRAIMNWLGRVLDLATLVTDCGSTKRCIVEAARKHARCGRLVAGHPMAGAPRGGAEAARADLFEGNRWLLCPDGSDADARARVRGIVESLGAVPVEMSAADHDRAVAITSHVPQILSSLLLATSREDEAGASEGPGFANMTRIAGGDATMWRDVFATNGDEIARALRSIGGDLDRVARDLGRDPPDPSSALELLERARAEQRMLRG